VQTEIAKSHAVLFQSPGRRRIGGRRPLIRLPIRRGIFPRHGTKFRRQQRYRRRFVTGA
jgi:hypothetical protein